MQPLPVSSKPSRRFQYNIDKICEGTYLSLDCWPSSRALPERRECCRLRTVAGSSPWRGLPSPSAGCIASSVTSRDRIRETYVLSRALQCTQVHSTSDTELTDDIEFRRIPWICYSLTISVNGLHAIKTLEYWKTKSKTKFSSLVLSNVTVRVLSGWAVSGSSSEAGGHPGQPSTPPTWPGQHNQWRRHSRRKAVGDINKYLSIEQL